MWLVDLNDDDDDDDDDDNNILFLYSVLSMEFIILKCDTTSSNCNSTNMRIKKTYI